MLKQLLYTLFLSLFALPAFADFHSIAFYYGSHPPIDLLSAYDIVVVDPDALLDPKKYQTKNSELFAYVSVGEVDKSASIFKNMNKNWFIATNSIWQAMVIDQTQTEWQDYFINQMIKPLWDKGYRGFFFDTLDSYQLAGGGDKTQAAQRDALIHLLQRVKTSYPDARLILNRGFELIPSLQGKVYAVAAESLFSSWDEKNQRYVDVPAPERASLLDELKPIQKLNIPIIIIDYLPPQQKEHAQKIAGQIRALGMIPWITDGRLSTMGVGNVTAMPRKIFVVYTPNEISTLFDPSAFILLGMPLEYLGYMPEYHDANQPLPDNIDVSNYAGIIVWAFPKSELLQNSLRTWLMKRLKQSIPIVFFGGFGFIPTIPNLAPFNLTLPKKVAPHESVHINYQDKTFLNFEVKPYAIRFDFLPVQAKNSRVILQLKNERDDTEDAIAITPWGGYALEPYISMQMPNDGEMWILDPFKFLQESLRLPMMPVPDVTTENGRRLMYIHIDGDGFDSKSEWLGGRSGGSEINEKILHQYKLPTSASIIVSDVSPKGLYPSAAKEFEKDARDIFKLPWVEVATHTFSHPFDWILAEKYPNNTKYRLPVPNYTFDINTEIGGSAQFINENLSAKDKPCKIIFWSGEANPTEAQLAITFRDNLLNLNGGNTNLTDLFHSITTVTPMGQQQGVYYQVYAPISNEEDFTDSWSPPFYGFQKVIQTFEMTNSPRRLKPIDLYYHFYSGTKLSAIKALKTIYDWALTQPVMNIFASEYINKVFDSNRTSIASYGDGFQVNNHGDLRELRAPIALGYPDLQRSHNLAGYLRVNDYYYLHLGTDTRSLIFFAKQPSSLPYLVEANGKIILFKREKDRFVIRFKGHVPLQWQFANMGNCKATRNNSNLSEGKRVNNVASFTLKEEDSNDVQVNCK